MLALRALLFAVFGGFIGAAPAAPVAPARAGHDSGEAGAGQHSQKSERARDEAAAREARDRAAAPPLGDAPGPAAGHPPDSRLRGRVEPALGPSVPSRGATPLPPVEDVRAGLLGLPPPPR